jgi:hypothetical protein
VKGYDYDDGGDYGEYTWVCGPKSWSPDGEWIAFKMSKESEETLREGRDTSDSPKEIFAIHVDTLEIVKLTENYEDYRHWYSPDGLKMLFKEYGWSQSRDDQQYGADLLVMNLVQNTGVGDDNDGVPPLVEKGIDPDTGEPWDGDESGKPDFEENHVASFPDFVTGEYASMILLDHLNGGTFSNIKAAGNPSPEDAPRNWNFPFGFFDFTVDDLSDGQCRVVRLKLPHTPSIETYFKYGPTPLNPEPHWYKFMYDSRTNVGAKINHYPDEDTTLVDLYLCDGQRGDDDLVRNGTIVDQGGPASAIPIPTLSEWGFIAAALILGIAGAMRMRRRSGICRG